MTTIKYEVGSISSEITWAASEHFGELAGENYQLGHMEATEIMERSGLSITI